MYKNDNYLSFYTKALCAVTSLFVSTIVFAVPQNQSNNITFSFDRSNIPGDQYIWNRTLADNESSTASRKIVLLCNSASDTSVGACPTNFLYQNVSSTSTISLRFTEERSSSFVDVNIVGFRQVGNCPGISWVDTPRRMLNNEWDYANGGYFSHCTYFTVWIPQSSFSTFPFGGIWKANLNLALYKSWAKAADISSNITLNITDNARADIIFPGVNNSSPSVNLNLIEGSNITGGANIDLCLYDGYNLNSNWLELKITDVTSAPHRVDDRFSIFDSSGNLAATNRIDFNVLLNHDGKSYAMKNGNAVTLTQSRNSSANSTTISGISGTVLCSPANLELRVVPFNKFSKRPGSYNGTLNVDFTASAATTP